MKRVCPEHKCKMDHTSTLYGGRYDCPMDGCTMMCWDGPTSTPADQETRDARKAAHAAFDALWKPGPNIRGNRSNKRRSNAYKALAEHMGLSIKETHIGMFSKDQCEAVTEFVKARQVIS